MQHYRLLRNNKESGPYTWKELVDLPLKPYDLIWVDGKSAAWRYPSELPEFKSVAPAVEEDFYLSFHKRPAASGAVEKTVEKTALPLEETPRKKSISVILPNSGPDKNAPRPGNAPSREPVLRVIRKLDTADGKPENGEGEREKGEGKLEIANEKLEKPEGKLNKGDGKPELEKINQPPHQTLEEAEKTIQQSENIKRKPGTTRKEPEQPEVSAPVRPNSKGRLVLVTATAAVLIFFAIKWLSGGPSTPSPQHPAQAESLPLVQTTIPAEEEMDEDVPKLPSNPALEFAALKRHLTIQPKLINVGMFSGISRLSLGIRNTHNQPIDSIRLAVDFLSRDQSLDHTEIITVPRVEANSEITVKVPANGKGRAVQTRILSIGKYSGE
jgi:hypothetical protein